MGNLNRPVLFILLSIIFTASSVCAQNLTSDQQQRLNKLNKQLEKAVAEKNFTSAASYSGKIGYIYWNSGLHSEAINSFEKSLQYNSKVGNKNGIKTLRYNLGLIYSEQEDYQNALEQFDMGIKIARNLNQKEGELNGLTNKASTLKAMGAHKKSIKTTEKALAIAKELNSLKLIRRCYGLLAENHETLGNSKQSIKYFDKFSALDKHIKKQQMDELEDQTKEKVQEIQQEKQKKEKALADKSKELETTKDSLTEVEKLTEKQKLELEMKELTVSKQKAQLRNERLIRYGLIGVVSLIFVFLVVIFFQFRQKKRANKLLEKQNKQINDQKTEIEKQRDLANRQKKDILDSIEYASRIQNALLPPDYLLEKGLHEYFLLFKPRDVVSGDFYWMTHKDNKIIIAAADCTGHGVPGAFMSMLGIAFLNEIVNRITENKHVYSLQANEILNQLRSYIIQSLHQDKDASESKDGIDIALTIIDFDNKKVQFSGAHNSLILIRDNEIIEKKADRMPVAIHKKADQSFTNHELDIKDNDMIYLFSDGYPDQIGGPKGRKFMARKFKNLLLDIHQKPMEEQKQILNEKYEEWRNGYQQLDDILIIGTRLKASKKPKLTQKTSDYDWQDYKILIAEDTEINFIFLSEALKNTGVNIVHAQDGKKAIERIENEPDIDLVLMDINMPKLDGFESTAKIRELRDDLPIIAQTALSIDNAQEKAEQVGCDDFITKPIKLKSFLRLIDQYLKQNKNK
jgi:CheY-like chemotaxis protein/serine phosphatase RsbU (regulator of sigma subunit)